MGIIAIDSQEPVLVYRSYKPSGAARTIKNEESEFGWWGHEENVAVTEIINVMWEGSQRREADLVDIANTISSIKSRFMNLHDCRLRTIRADWYFLEKSKATEKLVEVFKNEDSEYLGTYPIEMIRRAFKYEYDLKQVNKLFAQDKVILIGDAMKNIDGVMEKFVQNLIDDGDYEEVLGNTFNHCDNTCHSTTLGGVEYYYFQQ